MADIWTSCGAQLAGTLRSLKEPIRKRGERRSRWELRTPLKRPRRSTPLSSKIAPPTVAKIPGAIYEIFRADVRKESEVQRLVSFAETTFGGLSVLVNNASAPHGDAAIDSWMGALEKDAGRHSKLRRCQGGNDSHDYEARGVGGRRYPRQLSRARLDRDERSTALLGIAHSNGTHGTQRARATTDHRPNLGRRCSAC
jgi:hypothetical protein